MEAGEAMADATNQETDGRTKERKNKRTDQVTGEAAYSRSLGGSRVHDEETNSLLVRCVSWTQCAPNFLIASQSVSPSRLSPR